MFVTTQPDVLQGAAGSLSGLGEALAARKAAAAAPTTGLSPAASDLVSAISAAAQFGQHGLTYQQIAAQAADGARAVGADTAFRCRRLRAHRGR